MFNKNKPRYQINQPLPYNPVTQPPFQYEFDHLEKEIIELNRRIDELTKRLNTIDGYLGINNGR